MLYKEGKKFIFVHIPKNAGNTIRQSIFGLQNNDIKMVSHVQNEIEYKNFMNEHLTYDEHIEKYKTYNSDELFSFCFLRNPYERFISIYNHLTKDYFLTNGCLIRSNTSRLFIDKKNPIDTLIFLKENRDHYFFKDKHGYLQSDFIGKEKQMHFIGLIDTFDRDIDYILTKLQLQRTETFNNLNCGNHKHGNLVTNPEYIELVNSIYERDVQLYNTVLNEKNKSQEFNIIINRENVISKKINSLI
jgi:hypothetical protein